MSKTIKFELQEEHFNIVIHALSSAREKLFNDLRSIPDHRFNTTVDRYNHYTFVFNDMMSQARSDTKHMIPMDELGNHFSSEICPCNPRVDGNLVVHKAKDER